jgi:hypothetical protein
VLDEWFEIEVRPRLTGRCTLVRFADDAVMAFEEFLDVKRVLGVLGKRFARYGLSLHPDKTRFVDFRSNRYRPKIEASVSARRMVPGGRLSAINKHASAFRRSPEESRLLHRARMARRDRAPRGEHPSRATCFSFACHRRPPLSRQGSGEQASCPTSRTIKESGLGRDRISR